MITKEAEDTLSVYLDALEQFSIYKGELSEKIKHEVNKDNLDMLKGYHYKNEDRLIKIKGLIINFLRKE